MTSRAIAIETDRLLLARPSLEDLDAAFAIHGDPETNSFNPEGPHRTRAQSLRLLQQSIDAWERDGTGYCTVALRADPDTVIGFSGIRLVKLLDEDVLNLYYRYTPSAWGHGYAEEAARAALDLARPLFPDAPAVALIREDNLPSRRLAERLGLRPTGTHDQAGRLIHRS